MAKIMLILMLVVAYVAALVSSSSNNFHLHPSILTNTNQLTKVEFLQAAGKRGKERLKTMAESSSHGVSIKSTIEQTPSTFLMNLAIGTPKPSMFYAMIDTSSDFIWTQCTPCEHCLNQSTPIFDPTKSLSYSKVECSSNMCREFPSGIPNCGTHGDCSYNYTYSDGSYTRGVLSAETFTFEGNVSFPKLGFGCGFDNEGEFYLSPGIVGLGRGKLSLVSQMNETKFSYCLPAYDSPKTGLLSIGSIATTPRGAKTTPLINNSFKPTFYYLSLQAITIGNTLLPINKTKFEIQKNGTGGVVIDSGTTLTYLEKSAFDQVTKELTRQLKLPSFDGSTMFDVDLCYNITRPKETIKFPTIIFHFEGADFEVPRHNYFAFVDEIGCLMMGSSSSDGLSIFGNFQQQNALLVYDLANDNLSFLANTKSCAVLHM